MADDGHERVARYLIERIPALPPDLAGRAEQPLAEILPHGTFQAVVMAVQDLAPHLDRAAVLQANLQDLADWLVPELETTDDGRTLTETRPPRGSYRSPNTTIRPIAEEDMSLLYSASLRPQATHRWRFRGHVPAPEEFRAALFSPVVLAQFMVVATEHDDEPVGLVSSYDADLNAGHCVVAFHRLDMGVGARRTGGLMIEGILVFIQYLFDHFTFSKVYLELPEYNRSFISGGADALLKLEGEYPGHYYYGDRTWSKLTYAIYRDRWDEVASNFRGEWPEGHFDELSG